jgi:hypothetical protein
MILERLLDLTMLINLPILYLNEMIPLIATDPVNTLLAVNKETTLSLGHLDLTWLSLEDHVTLDRTLNMIRLNASV